MEKKIKDNKNNMFVWILLIIVIILVLFLPKIYSFIETLKLPKVNNLEENKTIEKKEIDEETLESIHYPLMRNSVYDSNTYYSLDEFTISDMSNNDILLNAFLDIYEGNMTSFENIGSCTSVSKQFDKDYIELRIKNILGKNVNYMLENFYVPEDLNTSYVGTWSYDSSNSRFIYNGLCESRATNTKYYNLEQLIKAEYSDKDIVVYYYVGFAKLEGNSYTIYNDPGMLTPISNGTISDVSELNSLFESLNNSDKKIYKYTFKNTLCSYNEYCLYKGAWVDEF